MGQAKRPRHLYEKKKIKAKRTGTGSRSKESSLKTVPAGEAWETDALEQPVGQIRQAERGGVDQPAREEKERASENGGYRLPE